jgi:chemotaxis protein histidine kinase CheA
VQTDNDLSKLGMDGATDFEDENQEEGLQWLLEMDLSEPEEKLFTVSGNDYQDEGLSAFETEVAGRPLVRGNTGSDNLENYVAEEIVISSESERSDIYAANEILQEESSQESEQDEVMAIDYSLGRGTIDVVVSSTVDEGTDILGLASDDDMGEKFLSIKRVKSSEAKQANIQQSVSKKDKPGSSLNASASADEKIVAEQGNCTVDASTLPSTKMTGAPVPTRVADPSVDAVANEGPMPEEITVPQAKDVAGYVASMPQGDCDEAFDNFLLGGEHLEHGDVDPESLTIDSEEGHESVDPSAGFVIDYHEDFRAMEGFSEAALGDITSVIAPAMQELTRCVETRCEELKLAAGTVSVEVMLGADEESIKECYAQGFQPVSAIIPVLPEPMQALEARQRDALYMKLQEIESGENWNELFASDFHSAGSATNETAEIEESLEIEQDSVPNEDLEAGSIDDIFGADFGDDFEADLDADFGTVIDDIEAAFSNLDEPMEVEELAEVQGVKGVQEVHAEQEVEAPTIDDFDLDDFDLDDFEVLSAHSEDELDAFPIDEMETAAAQEDAVVEAEVQPEAEIELISEPAPSAPAVGLAVFVDEAEMVGSSMAWCIPKSITFSYTSQSNAEIFADFLDMFIEEGSAELEKLESTISEWEKDAGNEAHFSEVLRTLHNMKGIAKGVGLQRLGTLVHNYETLLDTLPRPTQAEEQLYFRVVNAWLDALVRGIEYVTDKREDVSSELPVHTSELAAARKVVESTAAETGAEATVAEDVSQSDAKNEMAGTDTIEPVAPTVLSALEKKRDKELADDGAKVLAAQQSVRMTSEKLDLLLNLASQAQQLGVRASQNTTRSKRSSAELQGRLTSVRTHIGKIADRALMNVNARGSAANADMDALEMDQYSELQEAASILREGVEDLSDLVDVVSRQNAQIEALMNQQSSVISSISSSIQSARVVPVSRLMPGLRRIVRTVSTDLGKAVTFKVLNETGALDRDHYARLQIVLEHMVRNALDHGIESADDRLMAGKPPGGRITIDVRKAGGDYLIKLSDDGKGIDADAIRESAYEKGLDVDADELTDEEAIRLIFHKGFSTASSLSEISGRGVGMDIVLNELQQIGGDIQIQSVVGLGTSFEIRVPSNVSVNGALLVAAADESYAIPLNGLIAVEQVPVDDFFNAAGEGRSLTLFDSECEPAYLGTLCQGVPLPDRNFWDAFVPVIIAGSDGHQMAIAIDHVEEALELVVRSLGSQFSTVPGVAGAATTTDGVAIVALDLNLLVNSVGTGGIVSVEAVSKAENTNLLALVVDDSRTQRMVATNQLDQVGVETVTAENGQVAIDLLNTTHRLPDVVLLDVEMPVKDGIETLREIRSSRRYGHLPVIMVTSRTGAKHRALAKDAGCNAYMGKPFNFPALIEQINDLTGHELELS